LNFAFVLYIKLISYVCGYYMQDSEPKYCLHDSNWTANKLLLFALAVVTFMYDTQLHTTALCIFMWVLYLFLLKIFTFALES
jgi:hypothetical protein